MYLVLAYEEFGPVRRREYSMKALYQCAKIA